MRRLRQVSDQVCKVPGCGAQLIVGNTCGVCRNHAHNRDHCGCWRCQAKRDGVPREERRPPIEKAYTPAQERAAAELRRQQGWKDPEPPKQKAGEPEPVRRLTATPPDDWKGEHLLRGIKAPRGEGNGYNIGKAKWRKT